MNLAQRMSRVGESATLRVSRRAKELQAGGRDIVDLSAGEPDFDSPPAALEGAIGALRSGFTRYTDSNGIPELRLELAELYERRYATPWRSRDVLVTVGGKAALFEMALALFDDGHEVLIPSPCWVSLPEQVRLAGAEPVFVDTHGEEAFRLPAERLVAAFTPRTRGVILNSPCNPTGGVIERADLEAILAACAARGVVVIYDETYERFVYDDRRHVSAAEFAARYPETVIVVGSFSKTYAMTGWRVGYALGPRSAIAAAATVQSHATSNATTFAMHGALAALRHAGPDVERMLAEYAARREVLIPRLCALPGFRCLPPAGAFYAFPNVAACYGERVRGSIEFAELLLEEAGVAVVPGAAFGNDEHIRISFACSREELARGLDRIAATVATLRAGILR
jgi:aspartate aminotransferase